MRASLLEWVGHADALRHMHYFGVREIPDTLDYQATRQDDLYIALVGELFDLMRDGDAQPADWARLGNALSLYAADDRTAELRAIGVARSEAVLFSAAAFYFGGFPASARLTMLSLVGPLAGHYDQACFDLIARQPNMRSSTVRELQASLLDGNADAIVSAEAQVAQLAQLALCIGPDAWIPLRLLQGLVARFRATNLTAILPEKSGPFWTPLIKSLVSRGTWDFFPSQIDAIRRGLLTSGDTFSLQMPTGAGKTALCEALLFSHLSDNQDAAAVLLVPYRSLASELRSSLVIRLNEMGISSRCAYGGTVPSGDEVHAFDDTRALVATPETLSGIISANPSFAQRISLVICDEGHLLDAPYRGVGLELLLARMKIRNSGTQRFVFVSAIVPNIEEINLWLGGTEASVVRSDYRPAIAEFSVLRSVGHGASASSDLEMHPHEVGPVRYRIERFLRREDFLWQNPATHRQNTYQFASLKTRAIAAARKALPMGASVVFAANKRGKQGAVGLADELLKQMEKPLGLPSPLSFAHLKKINPVAEYLENEYGADWVGTRALRVGAVLHHGDIPQETREVVEVLLRNRCVTLGICTNTLAEGVNLPIRTLILYSVQRVGRDGARTDLLTRDIKNLVGRAGRAGSTTKGLVICANEGQWPLVEAVARQASGEPVVGALRSLVEGVLSDLAVSQTGLTNDLLEITPEVQSLVDGIDATLIDLAVTEIGEEDLLAIAVDLADQTFASSQTDDASRKRLRHVFALRAQRVTTIRSAGRLAWIRETGARTRMLDLVETGLLPMRPRWDDVVDPMDPSLVHPILEWAWDQPELQEALRQAYRCDSGDDLGAACKSFASAVTLWLSGATFVEIAKGANLAIDDMLGVHSRVVTYTLQTIVEQAIALLEKLVVSDGRAVSPAVSQFPEHLRFGVPTAVGCTLAAGGIRHRRAYVALGNVQELGKPQPDDRPVIFAAAHRLLEGDQRGWQERLGTLVFENTLRDIRAVTHNNAK